ncbi:hypothetical protein O3G_MSEX008454 [Manduca sexta]|uniref:Uncharacterized protein n=1 Tax=Manduca sexta TaxID=7130 RepID=A0A921Z9Q9_MANSE|nr:hypothetical protein O3G_MSEX008454 [Manduca sexta]
MLSFHKINLFFTTRLFHCHYHCHVTALALSPACGALVNDEWWLSSRREGEKRAGRAARPAAEARRDWLTAAASLRAAAPPALITTAAGITDSAPHHRSTKILNNIFAKLDLYLKVNSN